MASIHKLKVTYNNVFWMLLNYCSVSIMFVENCVPNSEAEIRNLVYKFMLRLDASDKKFVIAIVSSNLKVAISNTMSLDIDAVYTCT